MRLTLIEQTKESIKRLDYREELYLDENSRLNNFLCLRISLTLNIPRKELQSIKHKLYLQEAVRKKSAQEILDWCERWEQ